ncbi:MAG: hypothetical protein ABSG97_07860 [Sedimentisphaerales bacterium]|jgi:hypothetical protein
MANDTVNHSAEGNLAEQMEKKRPLPLWRRIALALVIAAMAGVLGLMLMAYIAEIQFCGEIRKISKAGELTKFPNLLAGQTGTQTGEDANGYYVDAIRQFRPTDVTNLMQVNLFYRTNMASLPAGQFPGDLREKVADTINKAKPIFENLDKGAQLDLSEFDIGVTLGNQVCKARLDSAQCAVFLSSLRTLDLILAGKGDAAADSIISTLQLTRVFDICPTILVQGRKLTCVGLACGDIQLLLAKCPPSENQLSQLQTLLEKTLPSDSLKGALKAERVYQLEIARNLIPGRIASKYLMADAPDLPERLAAPPFTWHRMRMFFASAKYLRDMAWLIKISSQPWPNPLDELNAVKSKSPAKPSGLIPAVFVLSRLTAETLAIVRCTTSAIAIERYRLQNGRIPDGLADICPTYIKSIPPDPFTGQTLLYTRDDQSYTVYSTGANCADDGGMITAKAGEPTILDTGIRIRHTPPK